MKSVKLQLLVMLLAVAMVVAVFAGKGLPPDTSLVHAMCKGDIDRVRRHLSWCGDADRDELAFRQYQDWSHRYGLLDVDFDGVLRHFISTTQCFERGMTHKADVVSALGHTECHQMRNSDGAQYLMYQLPGASGYVFLNRNDLYVGSNASFEEGADL